MLSKASKPGRHAGTGAAAPDSGAASARTTASRTNSPTCLRRTADGLQSAAAARPKGRMPRLPSVSRFLGEVLSVCDNERGRDSLDSWILMGSKQRRQGSGSGCNWLDVLLVLSM